MSDQNTMNIMAGAPRTTLHTLQSVLYMFFHELKFCFQKKEKTKNAPPVIQVVFQSSFFASKYFINLPSKGLSQSSNWIVSISEVNIYPMKPPPTLALVPGHGILRRSTILLTKTHDLIRDEQKWLCQTTQIPHLQIRHSAVE